MAKVKHPVDRGTVVRCQQTGEVGTVIHHLPKHPDGPTYNVRITGGGKGTVYVPEEYVGTDWEIDVEATKNPKGSGRLPTSQLGAQAEEQETAPVAKSKTTRKKAPTKKKVVRKKAPAGKASTNGTVFSQSQCGRIFGLVKEHDRDEVELKKVTTLRNKARETADKAEASMFEIVREAKKATLSPTSQKALVDYERQARKHRGIQDTKQAEIDELKAGMKAGTGQLFELVRHVEKGEELPI